MPRKRNETERRHATVRDFRDLDLMLKLREEGDAEGWVETEEMARSMGFGDDLQPVGIRLSWMRRYGMLEYDAERHMWRLSEGGERVTTARLRAAQSRSIEALPDESMIEVMANVVGRYHHADAMTAHLLRREFVYGTSPGLRRNGRGR